MMSKSKLNNIKISPEKLEKFQQKIDLSDSQKNIEMLTEE